MVDHVGEQFGDYRLILRLGEGGFGTVYLGERLHIEPGTLAAVKVLKTPPVEDLEIYKSFIANFIEEASVYRNHSLEHPHIIKLLGFKIRKSDGIPYLVMEYAPHGTLRKRHRRGEQVPLNTIITYVDQIAAALQYAHNQRLIHRDVKPENMLLDENDRVLLSDFGIAVVAHDSSSFTPVDGVGTAAYKAPEQILQNPKPASDQYALGVVVYEWLSGKLPFNGASYEIIQQHLNTAPPPLRSYVPDLSPMIEQVVMRALQKKPEDRYESVQMFADELAKAYEQSKRYNKFATVEQEFEETQIPDQDFQSNEDWLLENRVRGFPPRPFPPKREKPEPFRSSPFGEESDSDGEFDEASFDQGGQILEPPLQWQRGHDRFAQPGRQPRQPDVDEPWPEEEDWQTPPMPQRMRQEHPILRLENFIARTFTGIYLLDIVVIPLLFLIWQHSLWLFDGSFVATLLIILLDMVVKDIENKDFKNYELYVIIRIILGLSWYLLGWLVGTWIQPLFQVGAIFPLIMGFLGSAFGMIINIPISFEIGPFRDSSRDSEDLWVYLFDIVLYSVVFGLLFQSWIIFGVCILAILLLCLWSRKQRAVMFLLGLCWGIAAYTGIYFVAMVSSPPTYLGFNSPLWIIIGLVASAFGVLVHLTI